MQKQGISVKEIGEETVLSKREKGTYSETITKLINELMMELHSSQNREHVKISGPIRMITHDEEYKEKDADIEIAVPITGEPILKDPAIMKKELPPMRVVSVVHKGPYGEVGPSYDAAFKYITDNGFKMAGPTRELYLNSPDEVKEEDLLTEVQVPVE